ncbi:MULTISPECIES: glucose-6-phosphate dehydrogenase [Halomonadaceae]|uniref:Glucose-6-phosphate 1-dehydrogenase n=2 Tax=Bacteria TaxID=2 RepID=A0A9X4YDP6_9GAMM|nr:MULTISPECIES: glucose-6-phosphate dehydrogenase [Halomonas]MYL27799.1 glucose-6-phosphate dehydrogenase [Halomonas utahensis]MYL74925.1 glucose-6-phosphate dehydrogenase [Halomonas sp. 22501_18_FS]
MNPNDATPFTLVLFGAAGDLARRRLVPSLYALWCDGALPEHWQLVGVSRSARTRDEWRAELVDALEGHVADEFLAHVDYVSADATDPGALGRLRGSLDGQHCIFYLATRADLYAGITQALDEAGLVSGRSRIVLEKPIGLDYASAEAIESSVRECFSERQIFRIDHYLGKETVQNLLVLRFANSIFESQWNHRYIDHIQITIAESGSVAGRGAFYDEVGALRDMVQNHLLQLLCMTAMEPPNTLDADAVRDEKVKVLRALRPMEAASIAEEVVRGQYVSGAGGEAGYTEDADVRESATETFVAMRVAIDNWRWAGVPFYLRTGKRLPERTCEIVVHFRPVPHSIFPQQRASMANRLVFRLQPDEGIQLSFSEKRPGAAMDIRMSELSLNPQTLRRERAPDAYERLLSDVIQDNQTLFVRHDELMAAWEWVDPILQNWRDSGARPEPYRAGTWGPSAATMLLASDGRLWDERETDDAPDG